MMATEKIVADPIHGNIHLPKLILKIIDTPQFQRLRHVQQLGATTFVYPSATHTRFEHGIGVYHLARKMAGELKLKQEKEEKILRMETEQIEDDPAAQEVADEKIKSLVARKIDERDVMCVAIAGLVHDLGHGPYSHTWQRYIEDRTSKTWKHEEQTNRIFDQIYDNEKLDKVKFGENNDLLLEDNDKEFIKWLVTGIKQSQIDDEKLFRSIGEKRREKLFLFEIVANKTNSIDVDKWDYFLRDSYYLGMKTSFSYERLLEFAQVMNVGDKTEKYSICYRDTEILNINHMFYTRWFLHQRAYKHRVARSIEAMLLDAFEEADKDDRIQYTRRCKDAECSHQSKKLKLSAIGDDLSAYGRFHNGLTDRMLQELPKEHKARRLMECIENRILYKNICEVIPDTHELNWGEKIQNKITNIMVKEHGLNKEDFFIDVPSFDYGNKASNPMKTIFVYNKDGPQTANNHKASILLPKKFLEYKICCIYRKMNGEYTSLDPSKEEEIRKAFQETVDKVLKAQTIPYEKFVTRSIRCEENQE